MVEGRLVVPNGTLGPRLARQGEGRALSYAGQVAGGWKHDACVALDTEAVQHVETKEHLCSINRFNRCDIKFMLGCWCMSMQRWSFGK